MSKLPSASTNARLDELGRKLDELLKANVQAVIERAEALQRLQMQGETAPPMSERQVAIVLNLGVHAVRHLVRGGGLRKRFRHYGFHPDDVRTFLASQRNPNRERIQEFVNARRPGLGEMLNGDRRAAAAQIAADANGEIEG